MHHYSLPRNSFTVINAFAVEILRETGLTVVQASLANVGLSLISLVSAAYREPCAYLWTFRLRPRCLLSLLTSLAGDHCCSLQILPFWCSTFSSSLSCWPSTSTRCVEHCNPWQTTSVSVRLAWHLSHRDHCAIHRCIRHGTGTVVLLHNRRIAWTERSIGWPELG